MSCGRSGRRNQVTEVEGPLELRGKGEARKTRLRGGVERGWDTLRVSRRQGAALRGFFKEPVKRSRDSVFLPFPGLIELDQNRTHLSSHRTRWPSAGDQRRNGRRREHLKNCIFFFKMAHRDTHMRWSLHLSLSHWLCPWSCTRGSPAVGTEVTEPPVLSLLWIQHWMDLQRGWAPRLEQQRGG